MTFLDTTHSINLSCPINQLGYGLSGLNITKSLIDLKQDVSLFPIGNIEATDEHTDMLKSAIGSARTPDWKAPSIKMWHQHDMAQFVGNGTKYGFPIFELDRFTDLELHHLHYLDNWIVTSQWGKDIIIESLSKIRGEDYVKEHTHIVPLGVDREVFREATSHKEETIFFNCGKWEVRKGHDVLIKAFNEAFNEDDNVELWMMCDNPFYPEEENFKWERLYRSSKLGEKVRIIPRQKTQQDVYNVMTQTDCGVFPARAEGWNLELLEMMSCGKNVIATNYSAHTEFCNKDNCLLVDTEEKEDAVDGFWFRGQGQWASIKEKEISSLAEHMRTVHEQKKADNLKMNQSGVDTAKQFSWKNSAQKVIEAIEKDDSHT
jgi:glycosyltransferase involved in cell wall biosynthesis|tara:strand:- start:132 stop:1256 length:1125 start_codon:yes stop_codon:yes gene_type:complete